MTVRLQIDPSQGLQIHIAHSLGGRRSFNSLCKVIFSLLLLESYFLLLSLSLTLVKILSFHFPLSFKRLHEVDFFLKMGKCLPRLYTVKLATIFTADECAETILRFINAHVPGAQQLVAFLFILETIIIFKSFTFKTNTF